MAVISDVKKVDEAEEFEKLEAEKIEETGFTPWNSDTAPSICRISFEAGPSSRNDDGLQLQASRRGLQYVPLDVPAGERASDTLRKIR